MPVESLTDEQAAAYAAFRGAPSRSELERFFFPDDADRELIGGKRRSHNSLGFAVQLTTARYLEVFLDYPTDMPAEVVDYLAEQLNVEYRSAGGAGLPVDRAARLRGYPSWTGWRGPVRVSGRQMKWALDRAEEIADMDMRAPAVRGRGRPCVRGAGC